MCMYCIGSGTQGATASIRYEDEGESDGED